MPSLAFQPSERRPFPAGARGVFTESSVWEGIGEGWQRLHGSFPERGYSIESHDFSAEEEFDWAPSFHPNSVEICLNLAGSASVEVENARLEFAPLTAGYYLQSERQLRAKRAAGERHQFITVELSFQFLQQHLELNEGGLSQHLIAFREGKEAAHVSAPIRLTSSHQQMMLSLRQPPVGASAHRLWYYAKALEVASAIFYQPEAEQEFFCERQKRKNQERAQRVIALLSENLVNPLTLEEIGRRIGCSHFHLSRIFAQETGKSIFQYLRDLRLERAAQLLLDGDLSVTQVAMEVGYSSPSHFSTAFHGAFGCCPGLYPLATSPRREEGRDDRQNGKRKRSPARNELQFSERKAIGRQSSAI